MILKCPICGNNFDCAPSRLKKAQSLPCCSRKCAAEQKRQSSLNCICDYCGKLFHKKPYKQNTTKYNYCSTNCLSQHRKIIYQGQNNPNAFCRISVGNKRERCGYWWVYYPDHPFAARDGYIREHRYIAEQYLLTEENRVEINGQYFLSPNFEVHHKDLNKLNNDVSNLEVLTKSEHQKLHGEINRQAIQLYKQANNIL